MRNWLKRIWGRIKGDVIIRKARPTPSRDKLIYGCERNSLRDRFNIVRASAGYVPTRTEFLITGSGEKGPWAWPQESLPSGSADTRLQFYEYKYIRHILMSIQTFTKKNFPDGIMTEHKESIPYFIYELDPKYLQMLIDKMTARMKEFEPYISRETTAHTGYWEV